VAATEEPVVNRSDSAPKCAMKGSMHMESEQSNRRPLISAGTLLGIGMGGFVDGIVLHQILQVHNMLSAKRPTDGSVSPEARIVNMEINMVWDGLFHAFCWLVAALGLWMLWRAVKRRNVPLSGKTLIGSMVLGWGLFNLVEGIIDHHVLHVHHVVERLGVSSYDWAFLGVGGIGFIVAGWAIIGAARRDGETSRSAAAY
jgi:uncharacterized membrane protein